MNGKAWKKKAMGAGDLSKNSGARWIPFPRARP